MLKHAYSWPQKCRRLCCIPLVAYCHTIGYNFLIIFNWHLQFNSAVYITSYYCSSSTQNALCVTEYQCAAAVFNSSSFSWIIFQLFFVFLTPLSIVSSTDLISGHHFRPCFELQNFLILSQYCPLDECPKLPSTTQIISSLAGLPIIDFWFIPYYLKVFY